ncbi:TIM barrel protein [Nakamurella endophytica]|uniref:IolE protein n=1 Tax=Nakamurella endophytica TaxID=1748367 RepID=A0A917SL93_9ACTN|nr:TIM barrel protein [Nakamurella endophytica]GGL87539.1 IolE protein [Nakamurella endophytica]
MTATSTTSRLTVGSAPDSWGVWFPDDPQQVPAERFLDEVAAAGYRWIELGPYGYLPTDPSALQDALSARDLRVSAGTVFEHLHREDSWDSVWSQVSDVAGLAGSQGATHLVVIPDMWRDQADGSVIGERHLDAEAWRRKTSGMDRLGRAVREEYGMQVVFHPHADSHVDTGAAVERFLSDTDPEWVSLCVDTGHLSYCGGDNLAVIRDHPERIGYVHLKQVDPAVRARVEAEDLSFSAAVRLGAMVEPPRGVPDLPPVLEALEALGRPLFCIVEQDLYPCAPDVPYPIAQRTHAYLAGCRPLRAR